MLGNRRLPCWPTCSSLVICLSSFAHHAAKTLHSRHCHCSCRHITFKQHVHEDGCCTALLCRRGNLPGAGIAVEAKHVQKN